MLASFSSVLQGRETMGRCIIIAPLYRGEVPSLIEKQPGDLIICADGGYDAAVRYGIRPDLIIGDFDSARTEPPADGTPVVRLPWHKDDTDMVVCLRAGRERGYTEFLLTGCLGGRFCHSLANLNCLYDCALRGETAWMADGINQVRVLTPGRYTLPFPTGCRFLSLIAYTPLVRGICLTGTEWELHDAELTNRYPLGVSNQAAPGSSEAELSFTEGALVLVFAAE